MSKGSEWGNKKRKEMIKSLGHCLYENCNSTKDLQFAHLRPTEIFGAGRGLNRRMKDILGHLDDYTLLCEKHHGILDGKNYIGSN